MKSQSSFYYSPTYRIIKAMQATGNGPGVIEQFLAPVKEWAESAAGQDAEALRQWLPLFQKRPFYTATELSYLFPALAVGMGFTDKLYAPKDPRRLYNELSYGKLPMLVKPDGTSNYHNPMTGKTDFHFIVERLHFWAPMRLTQQEFENVLKGCASE